MDEVRYERVPGVPEVPDDWGAEAWPPTPPPTPLLTVADVEDALRRVLAERALDDEQRRQQAVRRAEQERREIAAQLDAVRAALPVDRPTGQGVDLAAEVAYVVRERDNARTALRESLRMQRREGDDLRAAAVTYLDGMMQVAVQRDRLVAGVLAVAAELERLAGGESAGVGMVMGLVASRLRALVEARPIDLGSIQPPTDSPQQTDKEGQES